MTISRKLFAVLTATFMALSIPSANAFASHNPESSISSGSWELCQDERTGIRYWRLETVYCDAPILPASQYLVLYAPEVYMARQKCGSVTIAPEGTVISSTGVVYTAETAPILIHNTSGGYSASSVTDVNLGYIQEGYVHVSIATRGRETQNAVGEYIGQFPALIVDMKAGIRWLRAHNSELPGSAERIVSRGFSSGGAVSAMLGASGNSQLFQPYLDAIGAADAADNIWMALCSAPITNLNTADAAYEWYQGRNPGYFLFNAMAYDREGNDVSGILPVGPQHTYALGSNLLGGTHEDELSEMLSARYIEYIRSFGFDLGEDGQSGSFYEGFVRLYEDALNEYIARYDELKTPQQPLTAEEYLTTLGDWFVRDPVTGVVSVTDLDSLIADCAARKKMCPSSDSYNYRSNENRAFALPDGTVAHFSTDVCVCLNALLSEAQAGLHPDWSDQDITYLTLLAADYNAVPDQSAAMAELMSPINYITGRGEYAGSIIAPFWRLRTGSEDGDLGAPAAWLIAQGLKTYTDAEVSVGIAWGMGHSLSELTEQDLYDYIADAFTE